MIITMRIDENQTKFTNHYIITVVCEDVRVLPSKYFPAGVGAGRWWASSINRSRKARLDELEEQRARGAAESQRAENASESVSVDTVGWRLAMACERKKEERLQSEIKQAKVDLEEIRAKNQLGSGIDLSKNENGKEVDEWSKRLAVDLRDDTGEVIVRDKAPAGVEMALRKFFSQSSTAEFSSCQQEQVTTMAQSMRKRVCKKGQKIFSEGDLGTLKVAFAKNI